MDLNTAETPVPGVSHPFRNAVLRGLAIVSPPLLTILFFMWVINTTRSYVLEPLTAAAREVLVWRLADIREDLPLGDPGQRRVEYDGEVYLRLEDGKFVPEYVYEMVRKGQSQETLPQTAAGVYRRYMDIKYLRPMYTVPFFVAAFVLLLYFLGKFMAAGIGRFFWERFEQLVRRLPIVRSVYSGLKQVSDFLFARRQDLEFSRVVAVQFPRKGAWAIGFVTSETFMQIEEAIHEPVLTVVVFYSPIPHTGATVTVPRRECIDLNMTIDQALQFIISCGVVVPPQQLARLKNGNREGPEALPEPQDEGSGMRDEGRGVGDEGRGTRDE